MVWFDGRITDAISLSKQASKLMLILVTDEAETESTTATWTDSDLLNLCKTECVCLKLKSESESGKQFALIYPVVLLPSTYLIGNDGKPIDVVAGDIASAELISKVHDAVSKNKALKAATPAVAAVQIAGRDEDIKARKLAEIKRKMSEKRIQKLEEEAERERQREVDRRKVGKQMKSFKEDQDRQKLKDSLAAQKREKQLDQEHHQRTLLAIAADRAEFKRKQEAGKKLRAGESSEKSLQEAAQKAAAPKINNFDEISIQYRFFDGTSKVRQYGKDATLSEAMVDIGREANLSCTFRLSQVGVKSFEEEDLPKTLFELNLAPRSCVHVIPTKGSSSSKAVAAAGGGADSGTGMFTGLVNKTTMYLTMITTMIFTFITSLFSAGPAVGQNSSGNQQQQSAGGDPSADEAATSQKRDSNNSKSRTDVRRRNKIVRLHDLRDSDDEDETWNGNSTNHQS